MTEQEAQIWAERLTRIWKVEEASYEPVGKDSFTYQGIYSPSYDIKVNIELSGQIYRYRRSNCYLVVDTRLNPCLLHLYPKDRSLEVTPWLSFFRRNCWLCGCDIEASAHEKAEWMQGFTLEELESWNLKT